VSAETTIPGSIILGAIAVATGVAVYVGYKTGKAKGIPVVGGGGIGATLSPATQQTLEDEALKLAIEAAVA